ncbi:apolipoprotein L3 [Monodon monoceros]|nr:apolipoprotein L3 [Monodon monoceros]
MTAGASLALSATGLGLGAVVAVTSVPTSIVEHASTLSAKTEVSRLVSTGFLEALKISPRTVSTTKKSTEAVQHIEMNTRAMETVKSNPALAADANVFITSGVIPVQSSQQEEVTFKGTALAMTKGARIVGAGTAGVSLLMEAAFLVKQAKHLHEGAKTESAERLRQQARELEKKLEVLTRIYERLQ